MHAMKLLLGAMLSGMGAVASAQVVMTDVAGSVGDVSFPERSQAHPRKGDFVNVANLRQMRAGLDKNQVRLLLGNPHFSEGLWGVKDWNYLFNFQSPTGEVLSCQYQVKFAKQEGGLTVASLHWDGPQCLALLNAKSEPPAAPAPARLKLDVSTDALFSFGKSQERDILPGGRERLVAVAEALRQAEGQRIAVIGHTDRIGEDADNERLSQQRAETVASYLAGLGVRGQFAVEGRGEREPVKQCAEGAREAMIACLTPNRRVEVIAYGQQPPVR